MVTKVLEVKNCVYILLFSVSGIMYGQVSGPDTLREQKKETTSVRSDSTRHNYAMLHVDSTLLKPHHKKSYRVSFRDSINLSEIVIVSPYKTGDRKELHHYLVMRRKTKKVWPYAVLAAERLTTLRERLERLSSNAQKKRYTRVVQHYIEDRFKEKLKNLTHSEGTILIKLMYRQTGETTYEVIRGLRSGVRAFFYNVTANLFTISLKEKYDPLQNKDDYLIEYILRRAFQKNQLEYQKPAIPINFIEVLDKWNS